MYKDFFGLAKDPFNMTPDPALLFMPPQHREALAAITHSIVNRKGFAVLIGDAGTGKTTLLARILRCLPTSRIHSSVILNPTVTPAEFLEMTLMDFDIREIPASKAQRLASLQRLLLQNRAANKVSVLVVDEAHKLSPAVLEEVRLLSNFEFAAEKLLQIVLSGQNELADVLNDPNLRQLKQRIAVRATIGPLARMEVAEYIYYRWTKCAGALDPPFSLDAIDAIATWSNGIPRLINAICDNALMAAFGQGIAVVDAGHVLSVAVDLDLKTAPVSMSKPEPPPVSLAPPAPVADGMYPVRMFDPKHFVASRPPLLARWADRLGLTKWNRQYE